MFQTIAQAFKIKDVRNKILITLLLLFVYRLGCYIPVPGVKALDGVGEYGFLSIMNAVSGGALASGAFFAMGIGPYINASIIMQLLAVGIPALERLSRQGEEGKRKISNYTRILTLFLAIAQAIGILLAFGGNNMIDTSQLFGAEGFANFLSYAFLVIVYTAGAALTMWIGERITDYGISNGISLLIFTGIISTAGGAILGLIEQLFTPQAGTAAWQLIGFIIAAVLIFTAITAVNSAERKIPVQYAKQVKGRKMYGGQSTHIPMKINASGVMPLIFSFAILSFPELIMNLLGVDTNGYLSVMGSGEWLHTVLLCLLILFFAYFYNTIQFNPDDVSKSIQGNGGFIPGYRPGKPTADYLKKVSGRITLFGAVFLAVVALVPSLIFKIIGGDGLVNALSATGLLIVVSVALEFEQALQSQIMMKQYKGVLK